ncbi:MAG: Lipase 2 [Verrucomicrobiae bacterium]|nr:Lipase 2 [Verrucomicrobiae bacterium]
MSLIQTIQDIPYAKYGDRKLLLDLYLPAPAKQPRPAVLCVVGGGWRFSDKTGYVEAGTALAQTGYVAAALTYRVSSEVIAPGNVHDCKAAVRWLRANGTKYGIDPARIGAMGSSAGGHLVALLGTTNGCPELEGTGGNPGQSSAVQAVCDFCGPSDLTRIAQPEIRKQFALLYEVTAAYLGGPVEERTALAHLVSPLHHASPATVPMLIIHGTKDEVVPVDESIILYDALKKNRTDVTLHLAKGANHGLPWETHAQKVLAFFRRTLERR